MAKKKVLLMGKAHSGKTSMRSIIFANYLARDTTRLSPTLDVEHHHVRFLGDLVLNLWDCGGQDAFYESYFERDRESIFRSVELLIYVFDIESESPEKDFDHFCGVLEAIEENSPDARIFVLVHKMDLVAEEDRLAILEDRKRLISESCTSCGVEHFTCFGTSIWDESLYRAWSEIVTSLIPNIRLLETHLRNFCRACDADEVVLFERATFLVISHAQDEQPLPPPPPLLQQQQQQQPFMITTQPKMDNTNGTLSHSSSNILEDEENNNNNAADGDMGTDDGVVDTRDEPVGADEEGGGGVIVVPTPPPQTTVLAPPPSAPHYHVSRTPHFDAHRFEKISNIVKQFKLSCGKAQSQFQGMEVRNSRFAVFIDAFTANTYIMVVISNPAVHTAATLWNIQNARQHFEKFIPRI